jgi:signal transduction histidine kinase
MSSTVHARLAWSLTALSAVCLVVDTGVVAASGSLLSEKSIAVHGWPLVNAAALGSAVMGALIVTRHPRHPVGWLLTIVGVTTSVSMVGESYGLWVVDLAGPGPLWAGHLAGWVAAMLGGPFALSGLTVMFLLVPDGRLPSRRWRWVVAVTGTGLALTLAGLLSIPAAEMGGRAEPDDVGPLATALLTAGGLLVMATLLSAVVSMVVRLRRARGEARQQLRWIGASAACVGAGLVILLVGQAVNGGQQTWVTSLPLFVSYCLLPVAVAIAVLRHRLFDIDVIVNRAVVLTVGTLCVAAAYIAVVVGVGEVVGGRTAGFWPSLIATVVVAMAFQPLRRQVVRLADRLAYGSRAAPYDALSDFSRRIGHSPLPESLLPTVAEAAARAVSARSATARLEVLPNRALAAWWPTSGDGPAGGSPVAASPAPVTIEVVDPAGRLGSIEVELAPGHEVRPHERRLLDDIADQAALAFRNTRLEAELSRQVDALDARTAQLEASRRRLIEARDAERRRLAAAIERHVLPDLQRMDSALPQLQADVTSTDVSGSVATLVDDVSAALESLRDLTRGVFPTVLTRSGLGPALSSSHFTRAGAVRDLQVDEQARTRRFPARVEAAAYFCCTQALRPDLRAAGSVAVSLEAGHLVVDLRVDALDPVDRQSVLDRVEAVGGSLDVAPDAGRVHVRARIPVDGDAAKRSAS